MRIRGGGEGDDEQLSAAIVIGIKYAYSLQICLYVFYLFSHIIIVIGLIENPELVRKIIGYILILKLKRLLNILLSLYKLFINKYIFIIS